jgi:phospholipid transport system substrate-binding protein
LAGYRDHQIKVEPTKVKPGDTDVTVKTQVIEEHGQVPVPIDYSMEYSADGWKVYDVTVAGVSLVTNYRGSFNTQIRDGGVAKLLKTLQEKNRGLEARDKENKTATK